MLWQSTFLTRCVACQIFRLELKNVVVSCAFTWMPSFPVSYSFWVFQRGMVTYSTNRLYQGAQHSGSEQQKVRVSKITLPVFPTLDFYVSDFDSSNLCIVGEQSQSPHFLTQPDYGVSLPNAG